MVNCQFSSSPQSFSLPSLMFCLSNKLLRAPRSTRSQSQLQASARSPGAIDFNENDTDDCIYSVKTVRETLQAQRKIVSFLQYCGKEQSLWLRYKEEEIACYRIAWITELTSREKFTYNIRPSIWVACSGNTLYKSVSTKLSCESKNVGATEVTKMEI